MGRCALLCCVIFAAVGCQSELPAPFDEPATLPFERLPGGADTGAAADLDAPHDLADDTALEDSPSADLDTADDVAALDTTDTLGTTDTLDAAEVDTGDLAEDLADVPVAARLPVCLETLGLAPERLDPCSEVEGTLGACLTFDADVDGGDGSWQLIDRAAGAHHGTATAVTYLSGADGLGLGLDGSSDASWPATEDAMPPRVGLDVWIHPDRLPGDGDGGRFGIIDEGSGWSLFLYADGRVRAHCGGEVYSQPIAAGRWTHVACVNDDTTLRIFVDGAEQGSVASAGELGYSPTHIAIGRDNPDGNHFVGRIDTVRVWQGAPSAADVCRGAILWQE